MGMIFNMAAKCAGPLAALVLVAGCTTGPSGVDVTRFHLGTPIAKGSIMLEPADATRAGSLEFATYAEIVAVELRRIGFVPVPALVTAEYVGTLKYSQTMQAAAKTSGVSVGFGVGGGSFGGNGGGVGVGTGVQVPVGGGTSMVAVNALSVQIKRRSDQTVVWEGTAIEPADSGSTGAPLSAALPGLAQKLFTDFPGAPGKTVNYKK